MPRIQLSARQILRAAALALGSLLLMHCGRPPHPVARIGDEWIGQPEWNAYLQQHADNPGGTLDELVRQEIAWELAQRRGYLQGEAWTRFRTGIRQVILEKAYLDSQPGTTPFTEAQAKTHYLSRGEERHVLHLVCKESGQAETALRRLKRGEPFEKVAMAVSIDPSKARNHGDLGWIKRGQVVQPFAEAVFTAKPEEVCGPFKTDYGWHLAVVKEVRTPTEADFLKNKAQILQEMTDLNRKLKRPPIVKALRAQYPLVDNKAVLERDRTTEVAAGDESLVAGTVAGQAITLKDLKAFLGQYFKASGQSHSLGPDIKRSFMEEMGDGIRLARAAEKAGLDQRADVKAHIWEAEHQGGFDAFAKNYLANLKVPDSVLQAHHDQNPERFRAAGSLKLYLLVADDAQAVQQAGRLAQQGTPWKLLYDKYADRVSTGNWDAGWVEAANLEKVLPKPAVETMLHEPIGSLVGPVPGPDGYMLFKVLERKPGDLLPLSACLEAVRQDYLKVHGAERVDQFLDADGRTGLRVEIFPANAAHAARP